MPSGTSEEYSPSYLMSGEMCGDYLHTHIVSMCLRCPPSGIVCR